jgi:hypothetical protein
MRAEGYIEFAVAEAEVGEGPYQDLSSAVPRG